jgi:hypothetical protein
VRLNALMNVMGKGWIKTKASMHDDGVDILFFQSKES